MAADTKRVPMTEPSPEMEFAQFFLARGPTLRRTAYMIVRDWHLADDVTQNAMAKLYGRGRGCGESRSRPTPARPS